MIQNNTLSRGYKGNRNACRKPCQAPAPGTPAHADPQIPEQEGKSGGQIDHPHRFSLYLPGGNQKAARDPSHAHHTAHQPHNLLISPAPCKKHGRQNIFIGQPGKEINQRHAENHKSQALFLFQETNPFLQAGKGLLFLLFPAALLRNPDEKEQDTERKNKRAKIRENYALQPPEGADGSRQHRCHHRQQVGRKGIHTACPRIQLLGHQHPDCH